MCHDVDRHPLIASPMPLKPGVGRSKINPRSLILPTVQISRPCLRNACQGLVSAEGVLPVGASLPLHRVDLRQKQYASFLVANYPWSPFVKVLGLYPSLARDGKVPAPDPLAVESTAMYPSLAVRFVNA